MKKTLFLTAIMLCATVPALAQNGDLFPELRGRFKPAVQTPKATETTNNTINNGTATNTGNAITNGTATNKATMKTAEPVNSYVVNMDAHQQREGNIKLHVKNLKGVLPYARNFSYCFADVELTNGTNQTLQQLQVSLNYQGSENNLSYGGVQKGQKQVQKLMMNGPECASILTVPQMEVKSCKMENQTEDACKKRVQFMGPNE